MPISRVQQKRALGPPAGAANLLFTAKITANERLTVKFSAYRKVVYAKIAVPSVMKITL